MSIVVVSFEPVASSCALFTTSVLSCKYNGIDLLKGSYTITEILKY